MIPETVQADRRQHMNPQSNPFASAAKNVFSQYGEDGVIEAILSFIPDLNHWCVEFGAWDGIFLSNTYQLIHSKGYKAVLIEADTTKFVTLQKNLQGRDVTLINKFVTFDGANTLDNLLGGTQIPQDFDVLSIDIDGNDYHILESLEKYRPKVICVEFNPSIPNDVEYVQPRDFKVKRGASALSLTKLATSRGYRLVATTQCNLLFVDGKYSAIPELAGSELAALRDDHSVRVSAFVGYDGRICFSKPLKMPWHGVVVGDEDVQILPSFLRRYVQDYNVVQKGLFLLFLFVRFPAQFGGIASKLLNKRAK